MNHRGSFFIRYNIPNGIISFLKNSVQDKTVVTDNADELIGVFLLFFSFSVNLQSNHASPPKTDVALMIAPSFEDKKVKNGYC